MTIGVVISAPPGNALKNKKFDRAVFRLLGMSLAMLLFLAAAAHLLLQ
jgi:hypothetical protein